MYSISNTLFVNMRKYFMALLKYFIHTMQGEQGSQQSYKDFCLTHVTRKPIFGVCNQVRLKPVSLTKEAS